MVGKNIKKNRMQMGFTPRRLAEMAEISVDELREYEAGSKEPDLETIEALACALRMRPEHLIGWAPKGGGVRTRQQRTDEGCEVWIEWEKPWRMESCEAYPQEGAIRVGFEEVEEC